MPLTLELPAPLTDALSDEAARRGMTLHDYAVYLLSSAKPPADAVRTGADLVAFWESEGVIGSRPDISDSQQEARSIREGAQRRGG